VFTFVANLVNYYYCHNCCFITRRGARGNSKSAKCDGVAEDRGRITSRKTPGRGRIIIYIIRDASGRESLKDLCR